MSTAEKLTPGSLRAEYVRVSNTPSDIVSHLSRFVDLCDEVKATHVIELGTRTGVSTIAWLYALQGRGRLTSVDIDEQPPIGDYDHWTFIQGDDMDPAVQAQLAPAEIVFIDTSHYYDHTKAELAAYLPFVKPGGRMVLHDTQLRRPGGSPARPLFPVRTAVVEFVTEHGFEWVEHVDCWGLAVITIPEGGTHG